MHAAPCTPRRAHHGVHTAPCTPLTFVFVQGLEENLREAQAAAQRLETHLKQKEKLYEDKIKVGEPESPVEVFPCAFAPSQSL